MIAYKFTLSLSIPRRPLATPTFMPLHHIMALRDHADALEIHRIKENDNHTFILDLQSRLPTTFAVVGTPDGISRKRGFAGDINVVGESAHRKKRQRARRADRVKE